MNYEENKKVLIIDDEIHIRQSFAYYLEDRGFIVNMAENGRTGLEMIKNDPPDIVLLDLRMPEMDGLELLKSVRNFDPELPMIVISGANQIGDVVRALRYGAWDYLEKPVQDFMILEHAVDKSLEKAALKRENREYQTMLEEKVKVRTEEVKRSQGHYRTLFEKNNDPIFIIEKKSGWICDANEAAEELTGRKNSELKTLFLSDITIDADKILKIESTKDEYAIFTKPEGEKRTAAINTMPIDDDHLISIAKDITHDIEIEKQLRQAQKMEAIGTLAGGIAHDFNNILSGIVGYSQLAKMDIPKEMINHNLDQVLKASNRAKDLIQQILTFSRKSEYKRRKLKLYLIVKETMKFLRSSIPRSIEIDVKINSKSTVEADATQIHQVIMNLCTNSYHALKESEGKISILLEDIYVDENFMGKGNEKGNYVKLAVKDTGDGIPKEYLDKVFDPYFTTKKVSQGTGLGLAVVDGIIKKHQGFIVVESEEGVGTVFEVFFPQTDDLEIVLDDRYEVTNNYTGSESIMLIDDEEAIIRTTGEFLKLKGYKVTSFHDGISALEEFKKSPESFDLIITDMAMPKMKGTTFSEHIREIRKDIPIILCTGFYGQFDKESNGNSFINRFIQKPVAGNDLVKIIREELSKDGKS